MKIKYEYQKTNHCKVLWLNSYCVDMLRSHLVVGSHLSFCFYLWFFLFVLVFICFGFFLPFGQFWSVLAKWLWWWRIGKGGSWYPPARLHCQQKSKIENEKFKILREKNEKFKILERENEKLFFWNLKFKRKKSRIQNLIFTNQIALPAKLIKFSNWCSSSKLQI